MAFRRRHRGARLLVTWFLSIAAGKGFRVDGYVDGAVGVMGKNASGKTAVTLVTLHPQVTFSGARLASRAEIVELHHKHTTNVSLLTR